MTWKTIGILGGMGPEATAEFYRRIVRICQRDYGAQYTDDFPAIVICNLPVPDIVETLENAAAVRAVLNSGMRTLQAAGCDFIAVPCNTAFAYIDSSPMPLLNIVEETCNQAQRMNCATVGLLATTNTVTSRLYERFGLRIIAPAEQEQERVNAIVVRILAGRQTTEDAAYLTTLAGRLLERGAQTVVLGCTELPLIVSGEPFIDSLQILAERTVEMARGEPA